MSCGESTETKYRVCGSGRNFAINTATYGAEHELLDHAEDEVGPEDVQAEEDHQHQVEEVVAKEGWVVVDGVNPRAVDQPETHSTQDSDSTKVKLKLKLK